MRVFINQEEIIVFSGARIQDALLAYSKGVWKRVQQGELIIYDRFGNLTDPDGPVLEGQSFTTQRKKKEK